MNDSEEALKQLVERYSADTNTAGIVQFGSSVTDDFDELSDIDLYVLTFSPGKLDREQVLVGSKRADVLFDSISGVQSMLKEERGKLDRNVASMLAGAKILYSKSDDLDRIIAAAKDCLAGKTEYPEHERLMSRYSVEDFLSDIRREAAKQNVLAFHINCNLLIQNCVDIILKSAGEQRKKPSAMPEVLPKLDSRSAELITEFYKSDSLENQLDIVERLALHVLDRIGGKLPDEWEIPKT